MAENERDARLILRAEDRATKTFDAVAKSIANVREELGKQAKAAESGQGSLDDLQKSYKALQQAGDDLVKQQSAIKAFEKTSEAVERTATRLDAARKALEDYQTKLAGQDKVTESQTAKLTRLQGAVEKLTATYNTQAARVDKSREALTALGLSADKADEQLTATADSARLVADGLLTAKKAIDDYDTGLQAATVAAGELAAKNKLLSEAAKVGVDASQFENTDQLTAAIERQRIALDDLAAADKAEAAASRIRREQLISTAKEVASGNPVLEEQFVLLERLANEETRASGFRKLGEDAQAAATDLARFGNTATESQASITRLADAIKSTVAPAVAEVQTLDGALKQVDESQTLAASAQQARTSQYQDSLNKLTQAQAAFVRQAQNIDAFKAQQNVLAGLEADLGQAAEKYRLLGIEVARAGPDAEDLAKQLAAARRELESIGTSTKTAGTKLEQLGNALKRVGIDVNDVDGEFSRLQAGATRSAATVETLTEKVGGKTGGFLGLKPYELQNLSYQINDVFTSLASGISPAQTLAQQGGQIVQIFPQVISTFVRLLPVIIPVAVAIGLVAEAINRVNTAATAQRDFGNLFKLAGEDAIYSAKQFAAVQVQLEGIGYSADDAKKTLTEFFRDGLNPANLQSFLFVAQKLSDTIGISLPEAAKLYGDALSGGAQQVEALQNATHLLTDQQLANIEDLLKQGDVQGAHNALQLAGVEAANKLADAQTPVSNSLRDVKKAFLDFEDALGGFLQQHGLIVGALEGIAGAIRLVQQAASDAAHPLNTFLHPIQTLKNNFNAVLGKPAPTLPGLNGVPFASNGRINSRSPTGNAQNNRTTKTSPAVEQQIADLTEAAKATKKLSDAQSVLKAQDDAVAKAVKANAEAQLPPLDKVAIARIRVAAAAAEQAKVDQQNESKSKSAQSAADKAARAAETRQNKIIALTTELQAVYQKFTPENVVDPYAKLQSDAATAVDNIKKKFAELAKLGVTQVNGKTEADLLAQVAAYEKQQEAVQRVADAQKALNTVIAERKTALADIEDQVTSGAIDPSVGLQKSADVIAQFAPKLQAAGDAALTAAKAVQDISPSPEAAARIADIQKALQGVSDTANKADLKTITDKAIKESFDQLQALTAARDEFVRLQNQLVTAGVKSQTEAQASIEQAYNTSTPAILAAAAATQTVVDTAVQLGTISAPEVAKYQEQLALTAGETHHLSDEQTKLLDAYNSGFTQGFSTFFDSVSTSIAGLLDGTKSLGDVFKDIGNAALSFAATFTKAIADAIVQILALQAAKALLGAVGNAIIPGFHEGGVIGTDSATFRRKVPAAVFAGAVRYHTGGIAGLRPDEVPAILQKGEEVITAADPRNRMNGGLTPSAAAPNIKIVNTIDSGEFVSQGANTEVGQKAILNLIGTNASAVRAKLGLR